MTTAFPDVDDASVVMNALPDAVCRLDAAGRILYANPAAGRLLGWSPDALRGRLHHETVHPARADGRPLAPYECPILATLADGRERRGRETFRRRDGASFLVEFGVARIVGAADEGGGVLVFREATRRDRRVRRGLDDAFARALEVLGDAAAELDARGRLLVANHAMRRLLRGLPGAKDTAVDGRPLWRVMPPEIAAAVSDLVRRCRRGRARERVELTGLVPGRWHAVEARPGLRGVAVRIVDVTACRRLRDAEERGRRWLRATFDEAPIPIAVLDPDGVVRSTNRALRDLLGSALAPIDTKFERLLEPDDLDGHRELWVGLLDQGIGIREGVQRWLRADGGSIPVQAMFSVFEEQPGSRRVLVAGVPLPGARADCEPPPTSGDGGELLLDVLEHVRDGFLTVDGAFRFTYLNARAAQVMGVRREEVVGRSAFDVFPAIRGTEIERQGRRAMTERVLVEFEARPPRSSRCLAIRAHPSREGLAVYLLDVTAQRRAREDLARSEEWFRAVFETSLDGVVLLRDADRILRANAAMCALVGYTPEELLRLGPAAFLDVADLAVSDLLAPAPTGRRVRLEVRLRHKDGREIPCEVASVRFADRSGGACTSLVIRDLREQRAWRARLVASERRARRIVETALEGIATTDAAHRLEYVNPALAALVGRSGDRLRGTSASSLFVPEDATAVEERLSSRRKGRSELYEARLRQPGGASVPVLVAASPLLDELGEFAGEILMFTETRVQRRITDALELLAGASRLLAASLDPEITLQNAARLLVPALADASVIDLVEDGQVRRIVVAAREDAEADAERLRRLPPKPGGEAGVGRVLATGQSELVAEVDEAWIAAAAQSPERHRILSRRPPRSVLTVPLLARGRTIGALTLARFDDAPPYDEEDLSLAERLAFVAALAVDNARLYRHAIRAVQLRDEVVAMVSHDLRRPLHGVAMAVGALRALGEGPDESLKGPLVRLEHELSRADRLIRDLLEVSRLEAGAFPIVREPVRVAEIVEEAVEVHRVDGGPTEVRVDVDDRAARVNADRGRLLQVLDNLIGNALKFTPAGGRIEVRVRHLEDHVRVEIRDSGPGIAAESQPLVFDRFRQATAARQAGAGLGLAIAKGIVEAHGGSIGVESTPGRGSVFWFTVPRSSHVGAARRGPRRPR